MSISRVIADARPRGTGFPCTLGLLFSYVDLEEGVPAKHHLRTIRVLANGVLASLNAGVREALREREWSIERAGTIAQDLALPAFHELRSER